MQLSFCVLQQCSVAAGGRSAARRIIGALLRLEHRSLEKHATKLWPLIDQTLSQGETLLEVDLLWAFDVSVAVAMKMLYSLCKTMFTEMEARGIALHFARSCQLILYYQGCIDSKGVYSSFPCLECNIR